jgi:serine/threonine protein kinase
MEQDCAIKNFRAELCQGDGFVSAVEKEAKASVGLVHPNILTHLDFGRVQGSTYFVTEYFPSRSFMNFIRRAQEIDRPLDPRYVFAVGVQVCNALEFAHTFTDPLTGQSRGVLHTGLSPSSILISPKGHLKITGFGHNIENKIIRPTEADSALGRAPYLAPELIAGHPGTISSDLFSLGVTIWESISGEFAAKPAGWLALGEIASNSLFAKLVPEALQKSLLTLLAKNPASRFPTVKDAKFAMQKALFNLDFHGEPSDIAEWVKGYFDEAPKEEVFKPNTEFLTKTDEDGVNLVLTRELTGEVETASPGWISEVNKSLPVEVPPSSKSAAPEIPAKITEFKIELETRPLEVTVRSPHRTREIEKIEEVSSKARLIAIAVAALAVVGLGILFRHKSPPKIRNSTINVEAQAPAAPESTPDQITKVIPANETRAVSSIGMEQAGYVEFSSEVPLSAITVNGQAVAVAGNKVAVPVGGPAELQFSSVGYRDITMKVWAKAGETIPTRLEFQK